MRNLTLTCLVILILSCICISANAQLKIGVDFNGGFPQKGFKNYFKNGYGGDVYIKCLFLRKHLSLGVKAGYLKFASNGNSDYTDVAFLPLKGNAEFYLFTRGLKPFVGVDFGVYNVTFKESVNQQMNHTYRERYLGFAPLLGLGIGILQHLDINFTARFERIFGPESLHASAKDFSKLNYVDFLIGASFTF